MMKKACTLLLAVLLSSAAVAQSKMTKAEKAKFEADKTAIKQMIGCYEVTFEFAETFAAQRDYEYKDRKFERGVETVFIVEETPTKISLQHILVVNDTMIVKHWRQDWLYQNRELLQYEGDNRYIKVQLPASKTKGTWTQKVYQVDDSPRYEGIGTWLHVDGRTFWQSTSDAPLPRREFTTRSDYNILRRHSTMELTAYGWILEQDNEKIKRTAAGDSLIVWEKGFEKFTKGNFNCEPAYSWWTKNEQYWADVRVVWERTFAANQSLDFSRAPEAAPLFSKLFAKGDEVAKLGHYDAQQVQREVEQIIQDFLFNKG